MAVGADTQDTPWPQRSGQPILFLLDAANKVEQRLLEEWLESYDDPHAASGSVEQLVVPISRAQSTLGLELLETQLAGAGDVLVAPLRVAWLQPDSAHTRAPRIRDLILGDPRRPGALRAERRARRHPERFTCIAAEPATVNELRSRFARRRGEESEKATDQFSAYVARQAGLSLDIAERRLQGSRYKVPKFVADSLGNSAKFNTAIHELAIDQKKTDAELHQESRGYLNEMVAVPGTFHIDAMGQFGSFLVSLGYDPKIEYSAEGLERVRKMTRENPSALLWTHKSHVDGFAMYSACYQNDFPAPHILGGANMAFAGLGYLGRRAGAIFIRRSFQDNPLYKIVLRHYLGYLLEKRFPLSWAFEGTRSRVGKLMPPRYGLLKYVVEAARATDIKNVHIIPVSISYDLITDVTDYAAEQSGKMKQAESLRWFLGYLSSLRKPMGRIYIDFGEPVVLKEPPPEDDPLALSRIAFEVAVQVNKVTPITLPSLITMCLLGAAPQALTVDEVMAELRALRNWAKERDIRMSAELALEQTEDIRALADIMIERGVLTRYDEGSEVLYGIAQEQQLAASYYRNTVIHHFVNKAILELALVKASDAAPEAARETFWAEAEHLRNLFKFEFFYAPTEEFRNELREELSRYTDSWEVLLEQGRHAIHAMLGGMQPLVAHSTLLHYVEAYSVMADFWARLDGDQTQDEKACVAKVLTYGRQAYLQRRISSEASVAKQLFQNAYQLMKHMELTEPGGETQARKRKSLARDLHSLLRSLDRIRSVAGVSQSGGPATIFPIGIGQ